MPEAPKQLKVFLCHSSHDKPVVRELYQKLSAEGWIDPWLDEKKLLPGQDWNMEIEKAVETSNIVLVFLTNNSVNKEGYIQKELRLVLDVALNMTEDTIFIIPLKLEECQIPRRLQSWQWLNYFPPKERADAYERLLASLKIRANRLAISTDTAPIGSKVEPALAYGKVTPPINAPLSDPDLDLYVPPVYSGAAFTPPPAKVKTWIFGGIEFVKIPHGEFLMGSKDDELSYDNERPQHVFDIPYDFLIARFLITNYQFNEFVKEASYLTIAERNGFGWTLNEKEWTKTNSADWKHPGGPETNIDELYNHPVVQVAWVDELAYCEWLMKQFGKDIPSGFVFRAPTEVEWEKSARGIDGRIWPWGNEFIPEFCNSKESGRASTTPVGAYSPHGDSPYSVCDMAGNVWEWTSNLAEISKGWLANLLGKIMQTPTLGYAYPYDSKDGRENIKDGGETPRILRGGSFDNNSYAVRVAYRNKANSYRRGSNGGIRVVLAPRLP